jgi:hypothetical protein
MTPMHPIRAVALAGVLLAAGALAGCGDEPRWGAVDESTCEELDLAGQVADAFPSAEPATVEADASSGGTTGKGASDVTCTANVEAGGSGRLTVVVEVSSSGTPGENNLYGLRDGGELSIAGARVEVEPEPVDGWWDEGVRASALTEPAPPVASVVHLTVRDDNLVVAVQVSDWRGSELVDPEADGGLADAIVDAVPDVVEMH